MGNTESTKPTDNTANKPAVKPKPAAITNSSGLGSLTAKNTVQAPTEASVAKTTDTAKSTPPVEKRVIPTFANVTTEKRVIPPANPDTTQASDITSNSPVSKVASEAAVAQASTVEYNLHLASSVNDIPTVTNSTLMDAGTSSPSDISLLALETPVTNDTFSTGFSFGLNTPVDNSINSVLGTTGGINLNFAGDLSPNQTNFPSSQIDQPSINYDNSGNTTSIKEYNGNQITLSKYISKTVNGKSQEVPQDFTVYNAITKSTTTYTMDKNGNYTDGTTGDVISNLKVSGTTGEVSYDLTNSGIKSTYDYASNGQIIIKDSNGNITQMTDGGGNQYNYTYKNNKLTQIITDNNIYNVNPDGTTFSTTSSDGVAAIAIANVKVASDGTLSYIYTQGPGTGLTRIYNADGSSSLTNKSEGTTVLFNSSDEVTSKTYKVGNTTYTTNLSYDKNGNTTEINSQEFGDWQYNSTKSTWTLVKTPAEPTSARYQKALAANPEMKAGYTTSNPRWFDNYGNFQTFVAGQVKTIGKDTTSTTNLDKVSIINDAANPSQVIAQLPNGDQYVYDYNATTKALNKIEYIDKDATKNPTETITLGANGQWQDSNGKTYTSVTVDTSANGSGLPVFTEANGNQTKIIQNPKGDLSSQTYSKANKLIEVNTLTGLNKGVWTIDPTNTSLWLFTPENQKANSKSNSNPITSSMIEITDVKGNAYLVNTSSEKIPQETQSNITNPNDSSITRNGNGQITKETFGFNTYDFNYDSTGKLIGISKTTINAQNQTSKTDSDFISYDPTTKQYVVDADDKKSTNGSNDSVTVKLDQTTGNFSLTDSSGNISSYDSNGQITVKDSNGLVTKMTDQGGNTFNYNYELDKSGKPVLDSSGKPILESFTTPNNPNGQNKWTLDSTTGLYSDGSSLIKEGSVSVASDGTLSYVDTLGNKRNYFANGTETYIKNDGTTVTFNNIERPIQINGPNGNILINYNSDGSQITSVNSSKFGLWDYNGITWTLQKLGTVKSIGKNPLTVGEQKYLSVSFDNQGNLNLTKLGDIKNGIITAGDGVTIKTSTSGISKATLPNGESFNYSNPVNGMPQNITLEDNNGKVLSTWKYNSNTNTWSGSNGAKYASLSLAPDGTPQFYVNATDKVTFGTSPGKNSELYQYTYKNDALNSVTASPEGSLKPAETWVVNNNDKAETWVVNNDKGESENNPPVFNVDGTVNIINAKGQILEAGKASDYNNGTLAKPSSVYTYDSTSGQLKNVTIGGSSYNYNNGAWTADNTANSNLGKINSITLNALNGLPVIEYSNGNNRSYNNDGSSTLKYFDGHTAKLNSSNQIKLVQIPNSNPSLIEKYEYQYNQSGQVKSITIDTTDSSTTPAKQSSENIYPGTNNSLVSLKGISFDKATVSDVTGLPILTNSQSQLNYNLNADGSLFVTKGQSSQIIETINNTGGITKYQYGGNKGTTLIGIDSPTGNWTSSNGTSWSNGKETFTGSVAISGNDGNVTFVNTSGETTKIITANGTETDNIYINGTLDHSITKNAIGHIITESNSNNSGVLQFGYDSSGNLKSISESGISYIKDPNSNVWEPNPPQFGVAFSGTPKFSANGTLTITDSLTHEVTVIAPNGQMTHTLKDGSTTTTSVNRNSTTYNNKDGKNITVSNNGKITSTDSHGNTVSVQGAIINGQVKGVSEITITNSNGTKTHLKPGDPGYNTATNKLNSAVAAAAESGAGFNDTPNKANAQEQYISISAIQTAEHNVAKTTSVDQQLQNQIKSPNQLLSLAFMEASLLASMNQVKPNSSNNGSSDSSDNSNTSDNSSGDSGNNGDSTTDSSSGSTPKKKKHNATVPHLKSGLETPSKPTPAGRLNPFSESAKSDVSSISKSTPPNHIITGQSGRPEPTTISGTFTKLAKQDPQSAHETISSLYSRAIELKKSDTFSKVTDAQGNKVLLGYDKTTHQLNYISDGKSISTLSTDGKSWINNKGESYQGSISVLANGAVVFKHSEGTRLDSSNSINTLNNPNLSTKTNPASNLHTATQSQQTIEILNPINGEKLISKVGSFNINDSLGHNLLKGTGTLEISLDGAVKVTNAHVGNTGVVSSTPTTITFIESKAGDLGHGVIGHANIANKTSPNIVPENGMVVHNASGIASEHPTLVTPGEQSTTPIQTVNVNGLAKGTVHENNDTVIPGQTVIHTTTTPGSGSLPQHSITGTQAAQPTPTSALGVAPNHNTTSTVTNSGSLPQHSATGTQSVPNTGVPATPTTNATGAGSLPQHSATGTQSTPVPTTGSTPAPKPLDQFQPHLIPVHHLYHNTLLLALNLFLIPELLQLQFQPLEQPQFQPLDQFQPHLIPVHHLYHNTLLLVLNQLLIPELLQLQFQPLEQPQFQLHLILVHHLYHNTLLLVLNPHQFRPQVQLQPKPLEQPQLQL